MFCLRNEALKSLSDGKSGSGKKKQTKITTKPTKPHSPPLPKNPNAKTNPPQSQVPLTHSIKTLTLKICYNINIMPMSGLWLSGLAAVIGLGSLEDVIQSSTPMTHSSEITENVGIHCILHVVCKSYAMYSI